MADNERPRWSFTWLLRIQRIGHRRHPRPEGERAWWQSPAVWALIAIVGLEAIALVLLDVLPL